MTDTPTPRTDTAAPDVRNHMTRRENAGWDFARQLERELGAARDQLAAVTRERDTAIQHMSKQSRDAGLLEAEVERLRVLLRNIMRLAKSHGYDMEQVIGTRTVEEILAALGEE